MSAAPRHGADFIHMASGSGHNCANLASFLDICPHTLRYMRNTILGKSLYVKKAALFVLTLQNRPEGKSDKGNKVKMGRCSSKSSDLF